MRKGRSSREVDWKGVVAPSVSTDSGVDVQHAQITRLWCSLYVFVTKETRRSTWSSHSLTWELTGVSKVVSLLLLTCTNPGTRARNHLSANSTVEPEPVMT